jgi:hypothetical protein
MLNQKARELLRYTVASDPDFGATTATATVVLQALCVPVDGVGFMVARQKCQPLLLHYITPYGAYTDLVFTSLHK